MHRDIGQWFFYNFAAESFRTKKLSSRLYWIELEFYSQTGKFAFSPIFGGVRGNVHTSSIARRKALGRLPVHDI